MIAKFPLSVNGLNSPIKRQRLSYWIKTQDPSVYCCAFSTTVHFKYKDAAMLK